MDPNKTSQNWHTYNPRPSTHAPVTLPSTPTTQQSQYPHIQPRPQSQPPIQHHGQSNSPTVQFHHYQPPMKQAPPPLAQYPITAPFQVPRVPYPWPFASVSREQLGYKAGAAADAQGQDKGNQGGSVG